jgi:Fic family protein
LGHGTWPPLLPQLRQSLQKEARRRSSRATAAIEGVEVDVSSVESLERGMAAISRNEREVAALIKLYEWVQSQPIGYGVSETDCKHLHQLVWDGIIVIRK